MMRRFGFVINPIAGMGGSVGLRGTDGMVEEARRRGATPVAPDRARVFARHVNTTLTFVTCDEPMGRRVLQECGIMPTSVYAPNSPSTAQDTKRAVQALLEQEVDLLIFVGGDGTALDIFEAIGQRVPVLGVPAGAKMYSGVFAFTPRHAADIINRLADGRWAIEEREVVDIDEDKLRNDNLGVSIRGYLLSPVHDSLQCSKSFSRGGEAAKVAIAERMVEEIQDDVVYIIGGGTTTYALKKALRIQGSLLGVDIVKNGKLLCADAAATDIDQALGPQNAIIVSPMGGQGFVFGRGNKPITAQIIEQVGVDNITIIAAPEKLATLEALRVDTGDEVLDRRLRGFVRVITGHDETKLMRIE